MSAEKDDKDLMLRIGLHLEDLDRKIQSTQNKLLMMKIMRSDVAALVEKINVTKTETES